MKPWRPPSTSNDEPNAAGLYRKRGDATLIDRKEGKRHSRRERHNRSIGNRSRRVPSVAGTVRALLTPANLLKLADLLRQMPHRKHHAHDIW
jgi:hypothetical protein